MTALPAPTERQIQEATLEHQRATLQLDLMLKNAGRTPRPPHRDSNAEARRQAAIVEYVRWCAPQVIIFAVPNGGLRSKSEAARLKWTGVLAGALDLVLVLPQGRAAFWETKTMGGRLSADQHRFIAGLEAKGHSWALVRDIDDARRELAALGIETREVAFS